MGRKTNQCLETTPEKIEQINPENIQLLNDFMTYLRSVDRSELTINVYENDLLIFFCWIVDNAKHKFFTEVNKRAIMMFQNYALQQGCSASRVRHLKAALSSISNFIENILDDEYPNFRSVVRKIENPVNEPVREKTILTKEQVQSCLDYLVEHKKYEQACFLALAAYSGRRKAELARFKVSYFDDENIIYGSLYKTPEKIKTKGRGRNGKQLICYVLYKPFKPYLDLWLADRQKRGIESEWLFTDVHDRTQPITISRMNSFARTYSKIMDTDVYLHSLRHFMTSELARANIPDSVIQSLIGWDSADMVNVYKDIDADEEFGKYFKDGEVIGQKQSSLSDL